MSIFLDIDRTRSVFRLLFYCSFDSYGTDVDSANFDSTLFHVTDGVQVPNQVIGKLKALYAEVIQTPLPLTALASEVVRDFAKDHEILASVLRIVLRISNDEGMLCARDRSRVRVVAQHFQLRPQYYEHFSDFERGMLASCLRNENFSCDQDELGAYFHTLGCSPDMSAEEVRRRYRELVKEVHPDRSRVRGDTPNQTPSQRERFREIHQAYQNLRHALS